ncbi:MAG TPA: iron ABC transporter [Bacteroidales bacterium]|nr:MAG: iron ABC transporter [Bacteroidetes bacterium GWF2_33_38]OFY68452.1 MAG: iron ABC transporter [Bacteroidetes bacterium RIFOXYA12_FULL_33_9]HBF89067.1 iron ABC transporter [Bacteroidales bacterium]
MVLFLLDLYIGSVEVPINEITSGLFTGKIDNHIWDMILFKFRLPKAIVAVFAGIGLSIAGLQMQTVFRNPLAGPYVLGISSGAGLGVAILLLGFASFIPMAFFSNWLLVFAAWLGAALVLFLILFISIRVKDIMTILILGIMFGAVSSAIISIMEFFTTEALLKKYVIWTMGSLINVSESQLFIMFISISIGVAISIFSVKRLNVLLTGEQYAYTLGINVKKARYLIFISTSILAGTVTAFCGPIGFIGIVVPHISRMFFNTADHRHLIFVSALIGAIVMLISDIISQLPGSDSVLPINSVTSLIGIPIIIWIIIKRYKFSSTM